MYSIYLFVFVNTVFDYPSIVSCSHDFSRYVDASLSNHYNNSNQLMSNGVESMKISAKSAMEEDSVDGNRSFSDQAVDGGVEGRNVKKLSLAMLPLVFKVGAASTWMIVTMVLAAKSVLLGLILLIFKIAVSAGKVSSFFTGQFIKSQQYQSYNHHQPAPWHHAPPTAHDHNFDTWGARRSTHEGLKRF